MTVEKVQQFLAEGEWSRWDHADFGQVWKFDGEDEKGHDIAWCIHDLDGHGTIERVAGWYSQMGDWSSYEELAVVGAAMNAAAEALEAVLKEGQRIIAEEGQEP